MSSQQIAGLVVAAVLVFWLVGAYNRLVSLRNAITRNFVVLDAELQRRQSVLLQWLDGLRPLVEQSPPGIDALQAVGAADGQVRAALGAMRRRPAMPREATTLRLAEHTLVAARQRLQVEVSSCVALPVPSPLVTSPDAFADTLPESALDALADERVEAAVGAATVTLTTGAPAEAPADLPAAPSLEPLLHADTALGFARRQFNDATAHYNAARRQFPTWLAAALFGFRSAGTL